MVAFEGNVLGENDDGDVLCTLLWSRVSCREIGISIILLCATESVL